MRTIAFENGASPIEKQIGEKLSIGWIIEEMEDIPTNWTWAINNILKDVAKSVNADFSVACKAKDLAETSEWLYDFVCYEEGPFGLYDVIFVAESQWMNQWHKKDNLNGILYDFEKLILARCSTRIMIFEAYNEIEIQNYIARLNSVVTNCKLTQEHDRYMYVAWNIANEDFYIDLYIHN